MAETVLVNTSAKRIGVVTGGNKGIGYEICRQLASNGVLVILTARDVNRGNEAVEKLKAKGQEDDVIFHQLDVTDPHSIASLAQFIHTHFGKLDILVNNAGITGSQVNEEDRNDLKIGLGEITGPGAKTGVLKKIVKQTYETAQQCLKTNYYGNKMVTESLIPLLQQSSSATIVNVSSSLGQLQYIPNEKAKKELGDVEGLTEEKVEKLVEEFLQDVKEGSIETKEWPPIFAAYFVSKAALNAYTRILARKYPKITINAVCPGYTSTDLNFNTGVLSVEEGAKSPVMVALMPPGGPSGLFFDKTEISTF